MASIQRLWRWGSLLGLQETKAEGLSEPGGWEEPKQNRESHKGENEEEEEGV